MIDTQDTHGGKPHYTHLGNRLMVNNLDNLIDITLVMKSNN